MKAQNNKGGATSTSRVRTQIRAGGLASSPLGIIPPGTVGP
jgi:hypothetical protein